MPELAIGIIGGLAVGAVLGALGWFWVRAWDEGDRRHDSTASRLCSLEDRIDNVERESMQRDQDLRDQTASTRELKNMREDLREIREILLSLASQKPSLS